MEYMAFISTSSISVCCVCRVVGVSVFGSHVINKYIYMCFIYRNRIYIVVWGGAEFVYIYIYIYALY